MAPQTMQAVRIHKFGAPATLEPESIRRPTPQPDELLVAVKAAGVNPADVGIVADRFKQVVLPRTPGTRSGRWLSQTP